MTTRKPPVAVPVARIPRWLAWDKAGRAHAYLGRSQAALCGEPRQEDRYQWPRRSRCENCTRIEARPAPESEGELRLAYGDR